MGMVAIFYRLIVNTDMIMLTSMLSSWAQTAKKLKLLKQSRFLVIFIKPGSPPRPAAFLPNFTWFNVSGNF